MPLEKRIVGIAGLGLMGGAIARAMGKLNPALILAHDIDSAVLRSAEQGGVIAKGFEDPVSMLSRCDLVFLCLNPSTLIRFTEEHMTSFKEGAILTDVGGIKESIAALADRVRPDLDFIPGHPMAGSEKDGFLHSEMVDFTGKNYILTPVQRNRPENLTFFKDLILRMGFARITETTAEDHDDKIAFTSQLCHVIAASLIHCERDTGITRFGGGSFEDLTRIAMLNAPMWTELFLENRKKLLERITSFEKSLDEIKEMIGAARAEELEANLSAVRNRRSAMAE